MPFVFEPGDPDPGPPVEPTPPEEPPLDPGFALPEEPEPEVPLVRESNMLQPQSAMAALNAAAVHVARQIRESSMGPLFTS